MNHRCLRAAGATLFVLAIAAGCASGASPQSKVSAESEKAHELRSALLTEADLTSYRRQDVQSGTLKSLGFAEVFGRLRELKVDKPRCLRGYLGGVSGPAFEGLKDSPAAMAVFHGSPSQKGAFGQIITYLPADKAAVALDQPFPPRCSKITATLKDGRKMTITTREIDVAEVGEQVRAFRGTVTLAGGRTVIFSETIRSGKVVQNIQVQDGDKEDLEKIAKQAVRKARKDLRDLT